MSAATSIEKIADWAAQNPVVVGIAGTVMSLCVICVSVLTVWAARSEAIRHAHETSTNVTAVLVNEIARTVETSNNALLSLAEQSRNPAVQQIDKRLLHELLFERTAAQYVSGMGMTDKDGKLVDGCCSVTHRWDFSDRDYFTVHRDSADVGLYISRPYMARSRGGVQSIALSRRLNRPDGSFDGIVVVAIDLDYFRQLLSRLNVGAHGISAIVRADGTVLARNPPLAEQQLQRLRHSKAFDRFTGRDSGFFGATSTLDGTERLYTFQRVPGTSLIAVVAPAESDVLDGISRMAWRVGVSAMLIGALFCAAVWLLAYALRDNHRKQTLLTDLVRTDPMTGLRNRRALDVALTDEWSRLHRNGSCLSLLFIDADHFKQYNDRHGHAQGDAALKYLAACIRRHTRRGTDVAARYGGEEFVALLPDTDEAGAASVAECIRAAVESNRLTGFPASVPPFTVSIGAATGRKNWPPSMEALMSHADQALYEAKHRGRNQVCCVGEATGETDRPRAQHQVDGAA